MQILIANAMETADIITQVYQQIKTSITSKLTQQGYLPVHEEHHDLVYGSRYIIWSNNQEALRLTWDGKESWFILEVTESLPLRALTPWDEILVAPFEPESSSPAIIKVLIQDVMNGLS